MGNLRGRPVMDGSRRKRVSVRLNDEEYENFVALGGVDFVRNILAQAAKEKGLRGEARKPLTNNQKAE